jgi:predicted alpha/beta-fold hydrolase
LRQFSPLLRNPHLLTIIGNFAVRRLDERRFPVESRYHDTEQGVKVLVHSQRPEGRVKGEIVAVHGLEGSSNAGYLRSMAQLALENEYAVHRMNLRSCGGTEDLSHTMYHSGLTADALHLIREIRSRDAAVPVFLIGYSLGGNVSLKLAGELGEDARGLLSGVCAVSTPIDLAACVRQLAKRENRLYEWRFVRSLKRRIQKRALAQPGVYDLSLLERIRTVYEFDDAITAKVFGFGSADNYYRTQSSAQFLERIAVPCLLIQAKDDPMIPFEVFDIPAIRNNPHIDLVAVEHGGHLGFVSSAFPRFWVDRVILRWIQGLDAA